MNINNQATEHSLNEGQVNEEQVNQQPAENPVENLAEELSYSSKQNNDEVVGNLASDAKNNPAKNQDAGNSNNNSATLNINAAQIAEGDSGGDSGGEDKDGKQDLLQKIAEQEKQIAEMQNERLRLIAEMDNIRKRTSRDVKLAKTAGVSAFLSELSAPIENIYRALDSTPKDAITENKYLGNFYKGLEMVIAEFERVFSANKISRIAPKQGDDFNYELHQALSEQESTDVLPGKILSILHSGYLFDKTTIRPAMVVIAKAPQPAKQTAEELQANTQSLGAEQQVEQKDKGDLQDSPAGESASSQNLNGEAGKAGEAGKFGNTKEASDNADVELGYNSDE